MHALDRTPSGLVVTANHHAVLIEILDDLAPVFVEPGPRVLRHDADGAWQRLVLIPEPWCVRSYGPIASEVREAGRRAYELGAARVTVLTHELTTRPLGRLVATRRD
jgi:hypothetical protein